MRRTVLWQWLVVVFTLVTIGVNTLANILPLNGTTTAAVSDTVHHYFVPAGYVFSIWGLIYVALLVFAVYQSLPAQRTHALLPRVRVLYVFSSIANCAWLFCWHYGAIWSSVVVMLLLLLSLIGIYAVLGSKVQGIPYREYWMVYAPFRLYLGWVSVATVANISAALSVSGWNGWGISGMVWACMMICAVLFLSLAMLLRHRDVIFVCVIVWAIIGIAVHFSSEQSIVATCFSVVAVLLGMIGMHVFRSNGTGKNF
jgi:hypothetical protein